MEDKEIIAHTTIVGNGFRDFLDKVNEAKKEGWVPINNPMATGNVYNQFAVKYNNK